MLPSLFCRFGLRFGAACPDESGARSVGHGDGARRRTRRRGGRPGPLSLRLSGAGRSSYLDKLGGDAESDRYVKSHFEVDASAKYRINQNFQIFCELVNLNDATYTAYQKGTDRDRLLQYEEYSWTVKFGVKANF